MTDSSSLVAERQKWQQVRLFTELSFFDVPGHPPVALVPLGHLAKNVHHNSRQALKKYVKANNKGLTITSEAQFDSMFNKALKTGVEKGDFTQPKGIVSNDPCNP